MRRLALCLLFGFAAPAFAQTQYADGTGGYVALNSFTVSNGLSGLDATVGYRFAGGRDAGLRLGYDAYGTSGHRFVAGPVGGVSRDLGRGVTGRVEGALQYESQGFDASGRDASLTDGDRFERRLLAQDVTATVAQSLQIAGSVRLRPTLGMFANASQRLSLEIPQSYAGTPRGPLGADLGLHAELPVTFRLFGQDAALAAVGRLSLVGDRLNASVGGSTYAGGGLRLNL